jgi:hypothetical protein
MALFEDRVLTDAIEINTTPEKVFHYFKKKLDQGLSSIKQHMKDEGENLKRILENGE